MDLCAHAQSQKSHFRDDLCIILLLLLLNSKVFRGSCSLSLLALIKALTNTNIKSFEERY